MKPIQLEIITPMLSTVEMGSRGSSFVFGYLRLKGKYRKECMNEYPDDWKMAVDYLSRWVENISSLYQHRIRIRLIDAQSPIGLWKQLRYRVFKFPAFIVDRKHTYIGWDYEELEAIIDRRIHGH